MTLELVEYLKEVFGSLQGSMVVNTFVELDLINCTKVDIMRVLKEVRS
jgi:hypothetical protein